MVTTKLEVLENGDLELPPRPRRRLRLRSRFPSRRRPARPAVRVELSLSRLVA